MVAPTGEFDTVIAKSAQPPGDLVERHGDGSATFVGHDWGATLLYGATALAPERIDAIVPIAVPHPKTLKPKNMLATIGLFVMARHFIYFQLPWSEWGTRRGDFAYIDNIYSRWSPKWQDGERDAAQSSGAAAQAGAPGRDSPHDR